MKVSIYKEEVFEILPYVLLRVGTNETDERELNLTLGWFYSMCQVSVYIWRLKQTKL